MSARAIHVAGNRLLIALKSDTLAIAKAPRQYATGDLSWRDLQARGARRYGEVLADLADMRPEGPVLPLEGRNADLRRKGIAWLEEAIGSACEFSK